MQWGNRPRFTFTPVGPPGFSPDQDPSLTRTKLIDENGRVGVSEFKE